jgi:outer membrane protein assembly factor BamB
VQCNALAIDFDQVYVSGWREGLIQILAKSDLRHLSTFRTNLPGSSGARDALLIGLAIGPDGHLYVSDGNGGNAIHVYARDAAGSLSFVRRFDGSNGSPEGGFNLNSCLAFMGTKLIVAENCRQHNYAVEGRTRAIDIQGDSTVQILKGAGASGVRGVAVRGDRLYTIEPSGTKLSCFLLGACDAVLGIGWSVCPPPPLHSHTCAVPRLWQIPLLVSCRKALNFLNRSSRLSTQWL